MRAVIIGGGNLDNAGFCRTVISKDDFVICADSGYDFAVAVGITPDIVIGDLDSVKSTDINVEIIKYPVRKDATDGELAVDYALERGYTEIVMLGFIGVRTDHTLTNISFLKKIKKFGAKGTILDCRNEIRLLEDEIVLGGKKGDLVSIVPVTDTVCGVTTLNLEYPLNGENLYYGESRGVSNVMLGDSCTIKAEQGCALVIKSRD